MGSADDRRFEVLRAIVADFVATKEPIGSKTPRRAPQPRRLERDRAQRHGGPGGRGLHRPAAHQLGPGAHREGLPRVRRPARRRQAAVVVRAAGDPGLPGVRRRSRRRAAPRGAAAGPAHPPGGDRAVPDAVDVDGPASGGRGADAGPAAAGGDHRLRPRRPAHRRTRRRHRRASAGPAARTARRRRWRASRWPPRRSAVVRPGVAPQRQRRPRRRGRPVGHRAGGDRWSSTPRSGCCWAAPPT